MAFKTVSKADRKNQPDKSGSLGKQKAGPTDQPKYGKAQISEDTERSMMGKPQKYGAAMEDDSQDSAADELQKGPPSDGPDADPAAVDPNGDEQDGAPNPQEQEERLNEHDALHASHLERLQALEDATGISQQKQQAMQQPQPPQQPGQPQPPQQGAAPGMAPQSPQMDDEYSGAY